MKKNLQSIEVNIGNIPLGGNHPIRIQSMTNTNTMDLDSTVAQSIDLINAGCEYVRITAQGDKEAKHLQKIKNDLEEKGYSNPLIADIHFKPTAAEISAQIIDKVRINPGNYADKKSKQQTQLPEEAYLQELQRIEERFVPLIEVCKKHQTAMRIGSNHGSLSERIINQYGNTPCGMVEAAMEFVDICEKYDYHQLILSIKSSNVQVMIESYRLLYREMIKKGTIYPIHLGVTEAGEGIEGIIKSAAGIGVLLNEGIGDTIRVSLIADPVKEIPVAKNIVRYFPKKRPYNDHHILTSTVEKIAFDGEHRHFLSINNDLVIQENHFVYKHDTTKEINIGLNKECDNLLYQFDDLEDIRTKAIELQNSSQNLIVEKTYDTNNELDFYIQLCLDFSILLHDNLIQGLWIKNKHFSKDIINNALIKLLQATGKRISETIFISCPTCGRTSYDLIDAVKKVKARMSHLKGLKIGVMGCIVNGPGEMADADYGYIGAGNGKIHLYKKQECVKKHIPEDEALEALVHLIKDHGDWIEK